MADDTKCIVEECGKSPKARGLCSAHYHRWRTCGEPEPLPYNRQRNHGAPPQRPTRYCSIDDCDRAHLARGWCSMHYRRWQKHGDPTIVLYRLVERDTPCSIEGCDALSYCRGWCTRHYSRWRVHGDPLDPIRRIPFSLSDAEAAWLAGLFEGEGNISIQGNTACLSITMTDKDVIERVANLTTGRPPTFRPRQRATWQDQWKWTVAWKPDVEELLEAFLPWLGERRRETALQALECMSRQKAVIRRRSA